MTKLSIDTQETRRKFLGAPIEVLALRYIGCSARTYFNWVKNGTSKRNVARIDEALRKFSRKEAKS